MNKNEEAIKNKKIYLNKEFIPVYIKMIIKNRNDWELKPSKLVSPLANKAINPEKKIYLKHKILYSKYHL